MDREELINAYVELMGSDAEERGFYRELCFKTESEIVSLIIEVANYYKSLNDEED